MKKEFIPFEQSVELKELGFEEKCLGYWEFFSKDDIFLNQCEVYNQTINLDEALAPLYQQAFRWFREKFKLEYRITGSIGPNYEWEFTIEYLDNPKIIFPEKSFKTYEEAELACLKQLIKIVKDGK